MEENIRYISEEEMDSRLDGDIQAEEGIQYLIGTEEQVKSQSQNGGNGGSNDYTPSPYWDYIKNKLPDEQKETFKLPEDISAENEQKYLDEHLKSIYGSQEDPLKDVHPLAREIIEKSKEENFNAEEFVKSKVSTVSLQNATDDDLVKIKYVREIGLKSDENPNGLSEEDMLKGIQEMNPLEKRKIANEERANVQKSVQQSFDYKPDPVAMQKRVEDYNKGVDQFAEQFFAKESETLPEDQRKAILSRRTIAGVDLGDAEFTTAKEEFRKSFKVGSDGTTEIQKLLLNNDENLAKAYLFLKYEDKIQQALTRKYNEGVNFTFEKLSANGRQLSGSFGQGGAMSQEEIDARLNSPDGYFGD
jgi:hypothetical protein